MSPIAKRIRTDIAGSNTLGNGPATQHSESSAAESGSGDKKFTHQHKPAPQPHKQQPIAQAVSEMYSYKSNVFRMEMEEMLQEVALNYGSKRMAVVEKILHQLKSAIDAIPERKGLKIVAVEAEMKKRNIYIPFPEPKPAKDIQYQFSYAKPSYVNVAGSYALKTLIKQKEGLSIDLVLTMPSEIFQEKDYMNYRYFYKRAYYLSVVAAGIADSKDLKGLKVEYGYMNGDELKPILVISRTEVDSESPQYTINIIPSMAPSVFPPGKLFPSKNCVRPQQTTDAEATNKPAYEPTPFYNASLAADTTYFPYLALLHSSASTCAAFFDACILGRVWLQQRSFRGLVSKGGFGHFEWAILMAFLLKGGGTKGHALLATGYSNYQMFKAMIQFLASRNLITTPLVLGTTENVKNAGAKCPVVFDGEHGVNVLFKMTPWSYDLLRHEAERTLECLNSSSISDQFDNIFLNRVDEPCYRFDVIARLPLPSEEELGSPIFASPGGKREEYTERIYKALREGLNDRITLIHLSYPGAKSFAIKRSQKPDVRVGEFIIGLLLNAKNISRATDRGPSPEEKKKAAAFRKFWGSKAELRRFPDGSIIESVTWAPKPKVPIYQQIIRYVISHHFNKVLGENVLFSGDAFDHLLGGEQGDMAFQPVFDAFDVLDKDLKSLTGIPLAMRHVAAAAPAFRASTINLPFSPSHPLMEPADVVVQFESSSRWPDDLVAIQKTKASFLIKMGELLEEAHDGQLITRVGLENEDNEIMNYAFLDVIYLSGPAFRIRIYHDREATLLENRSHDPTLSLQEKEAAQSALAAHQRTFVLAPRHTDSIRQLCHRYPLMSPAIRTVKKWFATQLFSQHVANELLELIVARTFLCPYPFSVPSSIMAAFLRSLSFLAKWDWRTEPLILDLSGDHMKADDFTEIRTNFEAMRKKDPAMNHVAMFVASNHDRIHSLWTEGNRPRKVVAARITALARAVDETVKRSSLELGVQKLFALGTGDFDFVLQLNQKYVTRKGKKQHIEKFKNLQIEEEGVTAEDIARLSFDPCADYVEEISSIYKNSIIFFHGPSQPVVGGVWIPCNVRKWKPGLGYSTVPVVGGDEDLNVALNKHAILNEISRIGGELVSKVVVNRE
ncbi:Nrap protein [Trichophaea hybrida]|nr:Nrap protein [Trichophaea hybrida]